MNSLVLSVVVLLSAQGAGTVQTQAVVKGEPRQLAEEAMEYVARDDMKGLFAFIQKHMPMEKEELTKIRDNTIAQRKKLPAAVGPYVGYAFISECRKANIVSRVIFVEKRAKHLVRWQFMFYKPREKWQMNSFKWDADGATEVLFEPCG